MMLLFLFEFADTRSWLPEKFEIALNAASAGGDVLSSFLVAEAIFKNLSRHQL